MNKAKKTIVGLVLTLFVALSFAVAGSAYGESGTGTSYEPEALALKELGLFLGTEEGFQLERPPTRLEGAVMLTRILGKEEEARTLKAAHPFTDVPQWGTAYVGYLYQENITSGVSQTEFGAGDPMSANQYLTFVLRALGYSDAEGDFVWNEAIDKAREIGLLNESQAGGIAQSGVYARSCGADFIPVLTYETERPECCAR